VLLPLQVTKKDISLVQLAVHREVAYVDKQGCKRFHGSKQLQSTQRLLLFGIFSRMRKWYTIAAEIRVTITWYPTTIPNNGRRHLPPFYGLSLLPTEKFEDAIGNPILKRVLVKISP